MALRAKWRMAWVLTKWLEASMLHATKTVGPPQKLPVAQWRALIHGGGGGFPDIQDVVQIADVNQDQRDGAVADKVVEEQNPPVVDDTPYAGTATLVLKHEEVMALLDGHRTLDEIAAGRLAPLTATELTAATAACAIADLTLAAECTCPELAPDPERRSLEDLTPQQLRAHLRAQLRATLPSLSLAARRAVERERHLNDNPDTATADASYGRGMRTTKRRKTDN